MFRSEYTKWKFKENWFLNFILHFFVICVILQFYDSITDINHTKKQSAMWPIWKALSDKKKNRSKYIQHEHFNANFNSRKHLFLKCTMIWSHPSSSQSSQSSSFACMFLVLLLFPSPLFVSSPFRQFFLGTVAVGAPTFSTVLLRFFLKHVLTHTHTHRRTQRDHQAFLYQRSCYIFHIPMNMGNFNATLRVISVAFSVRTFIEAYATDVVYILVQTIRVIYTWLWLKYIPLVHTISRHLLAFSAGESYILAHSEYSLRARCVCSLPFIILNSPPVWFRSTMVCEWWFGVQYIFRVIRMRPIPMLKSFPIPICLHARTVHILRRSTHNTTHHPWFQKCATICAIYDCVSYMYMQWLHANGKLYAVKLRMDNILTGCLRLAIMHTSVIHLSTWLDLCNLHEHFACFKCKEYIVNAISDKGWYVH